MATKKRKSILLLAAQASGVFNRTGKTPLQLEASREEMCAALRDCVESLNRLPDTEGAYRVTCIQQAEKALKG